MRRAAGNLGKLLYSSGNFSASLTAQFFATFIIFFYVDTLKLSPSLVGLGMTFYGIWNAINDPLAGQISDRTRSRWGRRIPYVLFGSLPLAIAFSLVWMPPFRMPDQQWPLFAWFLVALFLYDTLYTLVVLNWTALYPEMYPGMDERARVSAMRQGWGILGMMIGTALPPMLVGSLGWPATAAVFAVLTALFLYLSLLGSFERPEFSHSEGLPIVPALRYTFANWSFLTFVLASLFIQFTFVTLTGAIPFYAKYVLRATEFQTTVMLGLIFIVAFPMVYLWSRVAVGWGTRRTMMAAAVLYGLGLVPFWFATSFAGGVLAAALTGVGLAGLILLFDVFIADITDEDELRTGVRREGIYFGTNGFLIRLGISLQAIVTSQVLTRSGYDANLAVQPDSAILGIRLLVTAVPWIALVLALGALWLYPLHGPRLAGVRKELALRRQRAAGD